MKKLTFLVLLFPFIVQAQAPSPEGGGVHFEDGLSWTAIQARAKAEHKFIFVDCYTSWCGPCKYMKAKIFPQAEAGEYFNGQFINVSIQLDTTKSDNDTVKRWYADAHMLAEKFNVRAYPTFLVFSPEGKPLSRVVGGNEKASEFIGRVKEAMSPDKQYYTLLDQYEAGKRDTAFLYKLTKAAIDAYDRPTVTRVAGEYLSKQKDLYTEANIRFIDETTQSSKDKGFTVLLQHPDKVDKYLGEGKAEQKVRSIIIREEVYPVFRAQGKPDWAAIQKKVSAKYPALANEIVLKGQVLYAQTKNDWPEFQKVVVTYMSKYSKSASSEELNEFAWSVFQHCPDMTCVSEALEWSKRSFKDNPQAGFYDTYANILYKMGKKDEAIAWEQKSIDIAPQGERANYEQTLEKMRKGEKTWD